MVTALQVALLLALAVAGLLAAARRADHAITAAMEALNGE